MNPTKNEYSLVDDLLVIYLVEALGITKDHHKQEVVEELVASHGTSMTKDKVKAQFKLTAEQEQALDLILNPKLQRQVAPSEDDTRIMDLGEEEQPASESKTLILKLVA